MAQLIVNDGLVDSVPDTVPITADNRPPVADAGADLSVGVGDTITLDGSGSSDPDDDSLSVLWRLSTPADSSATLSDTAAVRPTFVADVAGRYQVTLVLNDGFDNPVFDTTAQGCDRFAVAGWQTCLFGYLLSRSSISY